MSWQESNQPHHRFNIAATWELPIGKGKHFLSGAPKVANALVGGWKVAGLWTFMSGDFPQFGNLVVNGNPCISNPTPQHWFNTCGVLSVRRPTPMCCGAIRCSTAV